MTDAEHPGEDAEHPGKDADEPGEDSDEPGEDSDEPGEDADHGPLLKLFRNLTVFLKQHEGFLKFFERFKRPEYRLAAGAFVVVFLTCCTGWLAYNLWPRTYELRISGGDMLSNRHYLAKLLQREARKAGITLIVQPTTSTADALEKVRAGTASKDGLDLAFVPGTAETTTHHDIEHVATLLPEMVHLLVNPKTTKGMKDLRGKSVNLGPKDRASHPVFLALTSYAGVTANVDFVETNLGTEELLEMPENQHVPDAILIISSVPSYLVEDLVRKHSYQLVEIPFPKALALRHGWAGDGQILAYTYQAEPAAVPEHDIVTVSLNLHLLANPQVDPKAISALLEVLYSPSVVNVVPLDEKRIEIPSGYPLSAGLTRYLGRNDPLFNRESGEKFKTLLGLLLAVGSLIMAVRKSFSLPERDKVDRYDKAVARYAKALEALKKIHAPNDAARAWLQFLREKLCTLCNELHELRTTKTNPPITDPVRKTLRRATRAYADAMRLRLPDALPAGQAPGATEPPESAA